MIEKLEGQYIEAVRSTAWIKYVARQHCIEIQPGELYAQTTQEQDIKFCILSCFPHRRIFEKIPERLHLWRVEQRKITDVDRPAFPEHPGSDARRITIGLSLSRRRLRDYLIPTANKTTLLRCIGRGSISRDINE